MFLWYNGRILFKEEQMATPKSRKTTKKSSTKPKTTSTKKVKEVVETEKKSVAEVKAVAENKVQVQAKGKLFEGFFARKYDEKESVMTIFKNPKIYGAIIGEVLGTMFLSMLLLTLGVMQPIYLMFGATVITLSVFKLSGAHLNPAITIGMLASRRMSVIRSVLYIISQVIGAWLGLLIVNGFRLAGDGKAELPALTAISGEKFWVTTIVEVVGAIMLGFFFARALMYKKSALTFSTMMAAGLTTAVLIAILVSSNLLGLQNNFILNPAVAFMYQAMPSSGSDFGKLMGDVCLALGTYVVFPMIGGIIGFYISDFAGRLAGEKVED